MNRRGAWTAALIVAIAALLSLGWRLGASPLAGTEPHRVIPAQAMVATGDWLVPRLYGAPYLRKPPLHSWAIAAAIVVAGSDREAVHRLPSLLAGALACAACALAAWRWFGVRGRRSWWPDPVALAGGFACLSLVCLWGQWRSADVDATNAFFSGIAALGLLELGRRGGRHAAWIVGGTALCIGCALLVKGPACLPVVLGWLVGALWMARHHRARVAWSCAWALVGGVLLFGAWGLMALVQAPPPSSPVTPSGGGGIDWSGLEEVIDRAMGRPGFLLQRLLLPFLLLAVGVPVSALMGLPWFSDVGRALSVRQVRLGRGMVLGWLVAMVAGQIGGVDNPRYAYLTLIPLAPLGGALAAVALRQGFSPLQQRHLRALFTLLSIVLAGMSIGLWIASAAPRGGAAATSWMAVGIATGVTLLVAAWTIARWVAQRPKPALAGTTILLLLLAIAFGEFRNERRRRISSASAAPVLRGLVDGDRVVSGMWVMNAPELFLYAGLDVTYWPGHVRDDTPLGSGDWVVFQEPEWEALSPARRAAFDPVVPLPVRENDALAARFIGTAAGPSPDAPSP